MLSFLLVAMLSADPAGAAPPDPADFAADPVTRIAFGSCANQNAPQPIWDRVRAWGPDLVVMLGDNVYGDTEDMAVLRAKYDALGAKPEFRRIAEETPFLAVWDDHDYGANDSGREYPMKEESKRIMLDFFGVPEGAARRTREGNYDAVVLGPAGRRVQLLLLDLRTFRTPLASRERTGTEREREIGPYVPRNGEDVTMLGDAQWSWLEAQLREPAEVRLLCLSTQLLAAFNGWEAWSNFPAERARLLEVIRRTAAEGVVAISGDTHWAELSLEEPEGLYPILDLTTSGLTEVWRRVAPNRNRIVGAHLGANYGQVEIDWENDDPAITLRIVGLDGAVHLAHRVPLAALAFHDPPLRPALSFAGEWETDFGTMALVADGDRVAGRYGDDHAIELTVAAGVARGTWRHRDGAAGGPCEFRLSRDGRLLLGSWAFEDDRPAADGGLPYGWRGTRRDWEEE